MPIADRTSKKLFDDSGIPARRERLEIVPKSVLDLSPQLGGRRRDGGHDSESSRSEYSHFPREVSSLCFQLFLRNCKLIFDPFAGWGERHADAVEYGFSYIGFDISQNAIERAKNEYGVVNQLRDSETAHDLPKFDGLLTCPPYWNLERYSDAGLDAAPTFIEFIRRLGVVFDNCYSVASNGAVFCVMAGDWRADGKYYDLCFQVGKIFERMGATVVDSVILSRSQISKIKVMIPQAVRCGYTVKVHETLLVFKKP